MICNFHHKKWRAGCKHRQLDTWRCSKKSARYLVWHGIQVQEFVRPYGRSRLFAGGSRDPEEDPQDQVAPSPSLLLSAEPPRPPTSCETLLRIFSESSSDILRGFQIRRISEHNNYHRKRKACSIRHKFHGRRHECHEYCQRASWIEDLIQLWWFRVRAALQHTLQTTTVPCSELWNAPLTHHQLNLVHRNDLCLFGTGRVSLTLRVKVKSKWKLSEHNSW